MNNELVKQENTAVDTQRPDFDKYLEDTLDSVDSALPVGFNKARFVQNTIAFMSTDKGKKIMKQYGNQAVTGLLKGAYLGLDFLNRECYLVPFKNELTFLIDYRGAKKLAKKYSIRPITEISAEVVRKDDEFDYGIKDAKPYFIFKPKSNHNSDIKGAFAYVLFEDGNLLIDYMTIEEIENTRNTASKSKNSSAWRDYYTEMIKKVVLKRLCKQIEIEFVNPEQIESYNEDMAITTDPKEIRENEVEENANQQDFTEIIAQEEKAKDEV